MCVGDLFRFFPTNFVRDPELPLSAQSENVYKVYEWRRSAMCTARKIGMLNHGVLRWNRAGAHRANSWEHKHTHVCLPRWIKVKGNDGSPSVAKYQNQWGSFVIQNLCPSMCRNPLDNQCNIATLNQIHTAPPTPAPTRMHHHVPLSAFDIELVTVGTVYNLTTISNAHG